MENDVYLATLIPPFPTIYIFNKMKEGKKEVNTVSDKEKSLKFPKVEKSQSKTVDVSFKPITSLDDGITEEEMKELMEQQKRILNRRN